MTPLIQARSAAPKAGSIRLHFFQIALYKLRVLAKLLTSNDKFMRNILPFLAALVIAAALGSGCANTEKKLGRGMILWAMI